MNQLTVKDYVFLAQILEMARGKIPAVLGQDHEDALVKLLADVGDFELAKPIKRRKPRGTTNQGEAQAPI